MKKKRAIEAVIYVEGALVRTVYCDTPLKVTVLDLDEHSDKRWARDELESQPMCEMPSELAKRYKSSAR